MAGNAAQAAITQTCQTDEVTFGISGTTPASADSCAGWDDAIGANPTAEENWINAEWDATFGGGDFEFVTKWEGGSNSGSLGGVEFTLSAVAQNSGDYTLEWTDNGAAVLPETFDLVFVAKAAQGHGAFLFDDITLSDSPATGGGTFTIGFLNNGGNPPALSHLTMLARVGDDPPPPPPPNSVSESSTLAMLFAGTALVAGRRRQKRFQRPF